MSDSGSYQAASVGVLMTLAPKPVRTSDFSYDIFSGMVIYNGYPLTAAANANPTPVLPDVASTKDFPGPKRPYFSASNTILTPIRSFNEPPTLANSHLTNTSHLIPNSFGILFNLIIGVWPTASSVSEYIFLCGTNSICECGVYYYSPLLYVHYMVSFEVSWIIYLNFN